MVRLIVVSLMLCTITLVQAGDWETFGDWKVKALHDEMDTVSQVTLLTNFIDDKRPADLRIGFNIFGGQLVTLSTSVGFLGDAYWPNCDFNLSSVSVDGKKAVRLTALDEAGECDRVAKNGEAMKQLKNGSAARVRLGYNNGKISLNGFKQAWARALELSKR